MPWTLIVSLIVFAPLAGINIYVGKTLFKALAQITAWHRRNLRLAIVSVLVFLNLLPVTFLLAYLAAGRSVVGAFAGDVVFVDLVFTYPFWIALIISAQLFVVFGLLDIIGFVLKRLFPDQAANWNRRAPLVIICAAGFIALYSVVIIVHDTWTVRIVEHEVSLPPQFKSLSGFRIAQISDVQGDGRTTPQILRTYVAKVNSLNPDLVLFAGDLVTSGTQYIDSTAAILGTLKSRYGSIAAIGDHDIFSRKSMVLDALKGAGVTVVEDTTLTVGSDDAKIAVTVVTYTYGQKPSTGRIEQLLDTNADHYRILLVHQPAEILVSTAEKKGYQLFVAGHTHGGGIAFGIPGLFLIAPASIENRYVSGFYRVGSLIVSVTNGLGFTLAPVRYHAPAEIVIITLR
jgi:predicted MPP superfamily phosphohydrolase